VGYTDTILALPLNATPAFPSALALASMRRLSRLSAIAREAGGNLPGLTRFRQACTGSNHQTGMADARESFVGWRRKLAQHPRTYDTLPTCHCTHCTCISDRGSTDFTRLTPGFPRDGLPVLLSSPSSLPFIFIFPTSFRSTPRLLDHTVRDIANWPFLELPLIPFSSFCHCDFRAIVFFLGLTPISTISREEKKKRKQKNANAKRTKRISIPKTANWPPKTPFDAKIIVRAKLSNSDSLLFPVGDRAFFVVSSRDQTQHHPAKEAPCATSSNIPYTSRTANQASIGTLSSHGPQSPRSDPGQD
jgi:hypothetical protein